MEHDEPDPTADKTVDAILATARRGRTPLRHSFLQQGTQRHPAPGPLRALVTSSNRRAILLYMLAMAKSSAEPWDVSLPRHGLGPRARTGAPRRPSCRGRYITAMAVPGGTEAGPQRAIRAQCPHLHAEGGRQRKPL